MDRRRTLTLLVALLTFSVCGPGLPAPAPSPKPLPRIAFPEVATIGRLTFVERAPWPTMPPTVTVHRIQPLKSPQALALRLLGALPIERTPENKAELDRLSRAPDPPLGEREPCDVYVGDWQVSVFPEGQFTVANRRESEDERKGGRPLPPDAEARRVADAFLERLKPFMPYPVEFSGISPAAKVNDRVLSLGVWYQAKLDGIPVGADPVSVVIGPGAKVVSAGSRVRRSVVERAIPILTPKEAFQKLLAGEGCVESGPPWNATAYVDSVSLAYWQPSLGSSATYLLPVYIFKGEAVAQGRKPEAWGAAVEALRPEFLEARPAGPQAREPDALARRREVAARQWSSTPENVAFMIAALRDPDGRVRSTAARALGRFGDRAAVAALIPLLHDADRRVALAAARALARLPDPTSLAALLTAENGRYRWVYCDVAREFPARDAAAVDMLVKCARDKDPGLREWAVQALIAVDDPRVLGVATEALRDQDPQVRSGAQQALEQRPEPGAIDALIAGYRAEKDRQEREIYLISLSRRRDPRALKFILEALRDRSSEHAAEMVLADWGPDGYDQLVAALSEESQHVRGVAARALAAIGDRRAIPALAAALTGPKQDVYPEDDVYQALLTFGPEVCRFISPQHKDQAARWAALRVLAAFRDPRAYEPLLEDLRRGDNDDRVQACVSLGRLGDRRAVPALLSTLNTPSDFARGSAGEALGELREPRAVPGLLSLLASDDDWERADACRALGKIGDVRALAPLKAELASPSEEMRMAAAQALGGLKGPGVVSVLTEMLHSKDPELQVAGVEGLVRQNSEEAFGALFAVLDDPARRERGWILSAAQQVYHPGLLARQKALLHDPDPNVRFYAAVGLAQAAPEEAGPLLVEMATTQSAHDRTTEEFLVGSLQRLKDPRMAEPLLTLLDDSNAARQRIAAAGLGALRETRAVPRLVQLAEAASHPWTRAGAMWALGKIGDPRAVPVLLAGLGEDPPGDSEPDLRQTAARALGGCHDARAVEPLLLCLQEPSLRDPAAEALGMIGDPRARGPLTELTKSKQPASISVVGALAALGDTDATARLLGTLQNARPRRDEACAALRALVPLPDPRVTPALIAALRHRDDDVRATAAAGLTERHSREAVPALFPLLRETSSRALPAVVSALTALTGQSFGSDADAWGKWWKGQRKPE